MGAKYFEYLQNNRPNIIVVANEKEAQEVGEVAKYLDISHTILPDFRARYGEDLRVYKDELHRLNSALREYYRQENLLIAPLATIANYLPGRDYFDSFTIEFADTIDLSSFKEKLLQWGYTFVDIVEERGEVSIRGDIIDIFPPHMDAPVRISLFDDEVESMRLFEPQTQKSEKIELERIDITPAFYALDKELDALIERVQMSQTDVFVKDIFSLGFWYLEKRVDLLQGKEAVLASSMDIESFYEEREGLIPKSSFDLPLIPQASKYKDIAPLDIDALMEAHKDKKITIIAKDESVVRRSFLKDLRRPRFVYKDVVLNLLGPDEIILSLNKKERKRRAKKASLIVDELKSGDYVVHEVHGIGLFEGIKAVEIMGAKRDFVVLRYQGDDKLLLPVENLELLSRYIADSGSVAVVDKLGSPSFSRLKERVRKKLFEIASDIVKRAAERELVLGKKIVLPADLSLFQKEAGFTYTPDQKKAIEQILSKLQSGQVMDMLLSGDVGFGKTEVAMNAIFAVVRSGYQAAMVVPTTLLSNQHYRTLKSRLEPFGIKVARIDRFVSSKEKKETLRALQEGSIDVVVGTHALLGAQFKNIALVIIDEEHKFGVKQKEKLKAFSKDLHLLSMSATPIPRSLNMALSRLKDLSELTTPPSIRQPVRTYVKEYDDNLVKEVILREKRRGGQVFYIYNSIAGIEEKKEELRKLLPNSDILVLHSKIDAATTERELLKFADKKYDILLSTSIVESGIHMPNVNTIIVEGADRFGIADLHQLRGRVGRGGKEGYCYYFVEDKEHITQEAKKRLLALESNAYLGSGAALAYHDLEIRGGGNILGAQQSGHIKNIGYSLYLKMLEETIAKLTTGELEEKPSIEINLHVNAYLSKELIPQERLKLELYRRLSRAEDVQDVIEIEEEIKDRFGKLDQPSQNFLDIVIIKILGLQRGIKKISNYGQNITLEYEEGKKEILKAKSKDDDDILLSILEKLRKERK